MLAQVATITNKQTSKTKIIELNSLPTIYGVMQSLLDRKDTDNEQPNDSKLFISLCYRLADRIDDEKTN